MAVSEAQKRAKNKWEKENLKRVSIVMKKEFHAILETRCNEKGESKNGFIMQAIKEKLEKEGYLEKSDF